MTAYTTAGFLSEAAFCDEGMRIEVARRGASEALRGLDLEAPSLTGLLAAAERLEKRLDKHRAKGAAKGASVVFRPYEEATSASAALPHRAAKAPQGRAQRGRREFGRAGDPRGPSDRPQAAAPGKSRRDKPDNDRGAKNKRPRAPGRTQGGEAP